MPEQGNPTQMMIDAMTALTRQIAQNTEFLEAQDKRVRESQVLRDSQPTPLWERAFNTNLNTPSSTRSFPTPPPEYQRARYGEQQALDIGAASQPSGLSKDESQGLKDLINGHQETQSKIRAVLSGLASYGRQGQQTPPGGVDTTPTGGTATSGGGGTTAPNPHLLGSATDESALKWAILGEHGGPQAIRNMYLEKYGLTRSLDWAKNSANQLSSQLTPGEGQTTPLSSFLTKIPGVSSGTLESMAGGVNMLGGAASFAFEHPAITYAAYKGAQLSGRLVGAMNTNFQDQTQAGYQFGYGPQGGIYGGLLGGQAIFGFNNPLNAFSTASDVGAALNMQQTALEGGIPGYGFGSGLTSAQAQQDVQGLAGQGFTDQPVGGAYGFINSIPGIGHPLSGLLGGLLGGGPRGDLNDISENFLSPMQSQFPGAFNDFLEFTPLLRNSADSTSQLRDALANLGSQSRDTKESVGTFTASLVKTMQDFQGMGSQQGALDIGTGWTNATGLDPQIAAQIAQSPIFQGMALSNYGILPSGIADMNSGAFTKNALSTLQLMQRATSGLNQNKYAMVDGHRLLIQSGRNAQIDQMAQMMGMDPKIVRRLLGDSGKLEARSTLTEYLGGAGSGTGLWGMLEGAHGKPLTAAQQATMRATWNSELTPARLRAAGLTPEQIQTIDSKSTWKGKITNLQTQLNNVNSRDPWNRIRENPSKQTLTVGFTPFASKILQKVVGGGTGPSVSKQIGLAGGQAYNQILNSPTGDLSKQGTALGQFVNQATES